jgi:hypothetical protein
MKVSIFAFSTFLIFASSSEAFLFSKFPAFANVHGKSKESHQQEETSIATSSKSVTSTKTSIIPLYYRNEKLSTADTEQTSLVHLGLEYPPISLFGKGKSGITGNHLARTLLGGKGANLAEMSKIGLSVPPGFTITTECCKHYHGVWNQKLPPDLWNQILDSLKTIESDMNSKFGDQHNPLLLSVRSGAAASMPGMMDTVLNLGMNDEVVKGLAEKSNNARFVSTFLNQDIHHQVDIFVFFLSTDQSFKRQSIFISFRSRRGIATVGFLRCLET